jgi:hypothetical protein
MRDKKVFKTLLLYRYTTLSHRLLISSAGKPFESVNREGGCGIGERVRDWMTIKSNKRTRTLTHPPITYESHQF